VQAPPQSDHQLFRIILVRREAEEILLASHGTRFALPVIEIPRWGRIAQETTAAVENRYGIRVCCLFTRDAASGGDFEHPVHCVLLEACRPSAPCPKSMYWVPVASLSRSSFEDFAVVTDCLTKATREGADSGPFARLGWLREVSEWVAAKALPFGLHITGRFRQLNASSTFSLIRFETDGPALWFKAVGEPNLREFPIILALSKCFSHFVPRVIAARPEWNGWLMVNAAGSHPDEHTKSELWVCAAETLATLQTASIGRTLHLLEVGSKDARVDSLLSLVDPFFRAMAQYMEEQTKPSPAPLSSEELRALADEIRGLLGEFAQGSLPDTLGHLDFNPGNILIAGTQCIFLDWTEAAVAHPFLTFSYLFEHARRLRADRSLEELLVSCYAKAWESWADPQEIAAALDLAPLIAVFAYAAMSQAWRNPAALSNPETRTYLRSLTRRMKRESDLLRERKAICTS